MRELGLAGIRLEPDAEELLRRIPHLKESLGVNVELASPADFIPRANIAAPAL